MKLAFERFADFIGAGLVAGSIWFCFPHVMIPQEMKDLLGAVVNVGAILAGFLSTIWSILISMENKKVIQLMRDAGYHNLLFDYLSSAIKWLFVLAILSALGLLIDFRVPPKWIRYAFVGWTFVLVAALISFWRIMRIFSKVLIFDRKSGT